MSQARRSDLRADSGVTVTDDANTFKKSFQTVGRPPVTERNINDEYMRDPPHNEPFEPSTDRKGPGKKEGAYEDDQSQEPQEQVLGDQALGKITKQQVLEDTVNETSVHPGSRGDA